MYMVLAPAGGDTMMDNKPLTGIRIVTLALNVPGPVAVQRLQHLGASVIKIEPPSGDPLAEICQPWYETLCVGQTVLSLNLKDAQDHKKLEDLLEDCDLFLTSTRPSSLRHLSLTWSEIHTRFPKVCQVALIGYSYPDENRAGHDLIYRASLGLLSPPHLPQTLLVDIAGAERLVSTALTLLFARERGGEAGFREIALSECAEILTVPRGYGLTTPDGILGGGSPRYNLYETREGWIAVAALEMHFWLALTGGLGLTGDDIRYEDLREKFLAKTAAEWETWAISHDIPLTALR